MRRLASLVLLAAAAAGPAFAQAPTVQWTFGDSLSDDGNIRDDVGVTFPPPPYAGGRFSNGPVWAESLPGLLGTPLTPETNVAVGGALSGRDNSLNGEPVVRALGIRLPGLLDQVDRVLAARPSLDPGGLYVVWAGNNDAIALVGDVAAAPEAGRAAVRDAGTGAAVANVETAVRRLVAAGARRVLVPGIPDLGRVPDERLQANAAVASSVSARFNDTLRARMGAVASETGVTIETYDVAGLLRDAAADPRAYGFAVVDSPCLEKAACVLGGRAVQDGYLFWDDLHPTTAAHSLLARMIAADGSAPAMIGAQSSLQAAGQRLLRAGVAARQAARRLGASGLSFGGFQIADADGRLPQETEGRPAPDRAFSAFLTGSQAWGDEGAEPGRAAFSWRQTAVVAGVDAMPVPGTLVGVAVGYATGRARFEGDAGSSDQDAWTVGLYGSRFGDYWYVDAAASLGRDLYDRIRRRTFVGPLVAEGRTAGWTVAGTAEAGLWAPLGPVRIGPFAEFRWSRTAIDGYAEEGARALSRTVEGRADLTRVASVGVQADAALDLAAVTVRPRVRAAWERTLGDDERTVGIRSAAGTGIPVVTTVPGDDPTVLRLTAGFEAEVADRLSLLVEGETVVGADAARERSVAARLRWRF